MLSTLDSWIASLMKESMVQEYPPGVVEMQRLFDIHKMLMLYCMLILLHQPYVDEVQTKPGYSRKNSETRPSYEICSASATIITHTVYQLPLVDLEYLLNQSASLYAVLTAARLHLMNASFQHDPEAIMNGEINFLRSMAVLEKLHSPPKSSLTQTMIAFQERFDSRPDSILSDYIADRIRKEACTAQAKTPFYLRFTPALRAAGEPSPTVEHADIVPEQQSQLAPTPQPSTERSIFNVSSINSSTRENSTTSRPGGVSCKFIEFKKPPTKSSRKRRAGAPVPTSTPSTPASSSSTVILEQNGYNGINMNQSTQQQQQYPSTTTSVAPNTTVIQEQPQAPLTFDSTFSDILATMAPEQPSLYDVATFDNTNAIQMGIPVNNSMPVTTSNTNNYMPPTTTNNTSNDPQQSWMNIANGARDDDVQTFFFHQDLRMDVPPFDALAQQQQQQLPIQLPHEQQQQQLPVQPTQHHLPLQHHFLVQQQQQQLQEQQQQQQRPFQPPTSGLDPQMIPAAAPVMVSGFYSHHAWNQPPSMDVWEASSAST